MGQWPEKDVKVGDRFIKKNGTIGRVQEAEGEERELKMSNSCDINSWNCQTILKIESKIKSIWY